jgi:hypothetical protein
MVSEEGLNAYGRSRVAEFFVSGLQPHGRVDAHRAAWTTWTSSASGREEAGPVLLPLRRRGRFGDDTDHPCPTRPPPAWLGRRLPWVLDAARTGRPRSADKWVTSPHAAADRARSAYSAPAPTTPVPQAQRGLHSNASNTLSRRPSGNIAYLHSNHIPGGIPAD